MKMMLRKDKQLLVKTMMTKKALAKSVCSKKKILLSCRVVISVYVTTVENN